LIEMPEGLIDPYVKTVTFSQGGRPLVRMHYYATHPQSHYGDPRVSYDFPGMARERLQQQENVFQISFNGCGGNVAAGKYNDGSPAARDGLAERLFAGMQASAASTTYAPASPIAWRTAPLMLTPRDDGDFAEAACRALMAKQDADVNPRLGAAMALAFRARSQRPFELSCLRMGDVRLLHLPGEMMVEYQLFAQELAPGGFTAVAAYADCSMGYICLESMFPEGGYEPTASHAVPNSEPAVRAAIRQLIETTDS
jgi:hypothetical protein